MKNKATKKFYFCHPATVITNIKLTFKVRACTCECVSMAVQVCVRVCVCMHVSSPRHTSTDEFLSAFLALFPPCGLGPVAPMAWPLPQAVTAVVV